MIHSYIYAIIDIIANDLAGYGVLSLRNEQTAIRLFGDVLSQQGTALAQHPEHYNLLELGRITQDLDDSFHIEPGTRTVLTGATWLATQTLRKP